MEEAREWRAAVLEHAHQLAAGENRAIRLLFGLIQLLAKGAITPAAVESSPREQAVFDRLRA
jgi:hypothetical protein